MSDARRCPRCFDPLSEGGVARCAKCRGQLLDHAHAADLLEGRLRLAPDEVRALSEIGGLGHRCPGCRSEMKRFQLRGEWVDHCHGCGSLWLDDGEMARLLGEVAPRRPSVVTRAYADEVDTSSRFSLTSPVGMTAGYATVAGFSGYLAWWGLSIGPVAPATSAALAALGGIGVLATLYQLWRERLRIDLKTKTLTYTEGGAPLELRLREIERVVVPREPSSTGFEVRLFVGERGVVVGRHSQHHAAMHRARRIARAARLPMSAIAAE